MARIWIVMLSEPLPTDPGQPRLHRAGILANHLVANGHDVVWWTSNFDHTTKRKRTDGDLEITAGPRLKIRLLDGREYKKNISISRLRNHVEVARLFREQAPQEERPDVIFCALPTVELAEAAVLFGKQRNIPVILDIRDLWPDVLFEILPKPLRPLGEVALRYMRRSQIEACRSATGITGLTADYRDWGLAYAGRPAGKFDGVFPLAYVDEAPSDDQIAAASSYWDGQGLTAQPSMLTVVFFGTLGRHFNADLLIDGARQAARRNLPVKIVLCGIGEEVDRLAQVARETQNILLPGWVNAAQIWTLMRRAHLGLSCYADRENFRKNLPNKIIEYMSAGLPVINNISGVVTDLLTRHKVGVLYGSGAEFADQLAQLDANRSDLARMAQNALATFKSEFNAREVYQRLVEHIEGAAGAK